MTKLEIFSKNIMEADAQSVNFVGVDCASSDESKFHDIYKEEVNFTANKSGGYRSKYPMYGGNKGWNTDEGWKYRDRKWRDKNPNWKEW